MITKVKRWIKSNPVRSMRKMASELKISLTSMRRIVQDNLKMKSRARQKVPLLTKLQRDVRLQKAKALLNDVKHAASGRKIFFTDEKIFTVDAALNCINDRWIEGHPEHYSDEVKYKSSTQHCVPCGI